MNRKVAELIGTVFNIGKLPLAPGTWSSFFAVLVWYVFFRELNPIYFLLINIILFFLGLISSEIIIKNSNDHDPSKIVIDEWVGQWISLLFLPITLINAAIGFILFRFFDISKLKPISYMEKIQGGWGIMLDDVLAGLLTLIILYSVNHYLL